MANTEKNIVILGGGFGGLRCALKLSKKLPENYNLILIDQNKYHTYYPMLYEVATANLAHLRRFDFSRLKQTVAIPFNEILKDKKVKFERSSIKNINLEKRSILLSRNKILNFQYLVLALGSETNYFDIKNANKSFSLKSVEDAMNIRNSIDELFYTKKQKERIGIVIAGGGFTGCEFAAELSCFIKKIAHTHNFPKNNVELTIIEAGANILPGAKDNITRLAIQRLKSLKIKVLFEESIQKIKGAAIITSKNQKIEFDMLIWTAGVKANSIIKTIKNLELAKNDRAPVNQYLQISNHPDFFGIGDNIYYLNPKNQKPILATAQAALNEANVVAKNIIALIKKEPLETFKPKEPFFIIPLGSTYAIADIKIGIIKNVPAWILKHFVNLKYFISILPLKKSLTLWINGFKIFRKND